MRRLGVCCAVSPSGKLSSVRQFALVLFALGFLAWSATPSHAQASLEDFETGFISGASASFPWKTGGDVPWSVSTVTAHDGQYSAASGPVAHGKTSSIEITYAVNGAAPLSFYYKTSSEAGHDVLRFSIDGQVLLTASGETDWQQYIHPELVTGGVHTFKWEFVRDAAGEAGQNRVWVDTVLLPMANGLVLLSPQGGERWFSGDGNLVRWVSMGPNNGSTVSIEVSGDDMVSWQAVASGIPNTGRYIWTFGQLPPPSAPTRYVRIVSDTGATSTTPGKVDLWEENEGFESGGLSTWPWINNGTWQVASDGPFRGAACVRGNGKLSLQLNVAYPGFLRFVWKNSYYLNCYIDGVLVYSADIRDMVYRPVSVPIATGVHQIDFVAGNTCYIDCLSLPTGSGVLLEDPHGADVSTGARQAWISGYQQTIRWFNYGGTGSAADLQYSIDDGWTWVPFANGTGVENKPGHNAATVIAPAQSSSTFRVRVVPSTGLPTASKSNFDIWPETDGFESGGLSMLPWINSGSWRVLNSTAYRGSASVSGSGKLTLRVNTPTAGYIRFMYMKPSHYGTTCYIDGANVWSSDPRDWVWRPITLPVAAGTHTVEFSANGEGSAAYIDCINVPAGSGVLLEDPWGNDPATGARQAWISGYKQQIRWFNYSETGATAALQYSTNDGVDWTTFPEAGSVANAVGDNSFMVLAPHLNSNQFRVRVVTASGGISSSPASFDIWPETDGFESGGLSMLPWINSGSWRVLNSTAYRGSASVSGSGKLTLRVNTPTAGYIRFMYMKPSHYGTTCYIDGANVWSSDPRDWVWRPITLPVAAGTHTVEFSANGEGSAAYIDCINVPAGGHVIVTEPSLAAPTVFLVGDAQAIRWVAPAGAGSTVTLDYSDDGRASWRTIVEGEPAYGPEGQGGSYVWPVPHLYSTDVWLRVFPTGHPELAGTTNAALAVWAQDEGFEAGFGTWPWAVGAGWATTSDAYYRGAASARFQGQGTSRLETTLDFDCPGFIGFFYKKLDSNTGFTFLIDDVVVGQFGSATDWTPVWKAVPAGTHKLSWEYSNASAATTVHLDSICFAPLLHLTTPLAGQTLDVGAPVALAWQGSKAAGATVGLDLSTDGGMSWSTIDALVPNTGSLNWSVPQVPASSVLLRLAGKRCGADTAGPFAIRGLHWVYPNGGVSLPAWSAIILRWESSGLNAATVKIDYSLDGQASWTPIADSTENDGSYSWTVPGVASSDVFFRVTAVGSGPGADTSDLANSFVGAQTISEIKLLKNGRAAGSQASLVTAAFADRFYLQARDRSSGICVLKQGHGVAPGDTVFVSGIVLSSADDERYILPTAIVKQPGGPWPVVPVKMTNASIGGDNWFYAPGDPRGTGGQKGVWGGHGVNNIGLLTRTSGRVTGVGRGWFYIDDGSGIEDGTGLTGLYVYAPNLTLPSAGAFCAVTAVSCCEYYDGRLVSMLMPRNQSDVLVVSGPPPGLKTVTQTVADDPRAAGRKVAK